MALPTCVRCGGRNFELALFEPKGCRFKLYSVQCANCGGVVGVQEFNNITTMLEQQNEAIKTIAQAMNVFVKLD